MKHLIALALLSLMVTGCTYTPPTVPKKTFFEHIQVYNDFSDESQHRSKAAAVPKPFMIDTRPVKDYVVSYDGPFGKYNGPEKQ